MVEYGEGDFQRAFLGFHNSNQLNQFAVATAVSGAYSFVKHWKDHAQDYKLARDLYDNLPNKRQKLETQMARFGGRGKRYRKRGFKRRRLYKRRGYKSRGRILRKIKGINRMLYRKGIKSAEIKFMTRKDVGPKTVGTYNRLMAPVTAFTLFGEGDNFDQRVGGKAFVRKIRLQIAFFANNLNTDEQYVKWIVVRDKHPNPSAMPIVDPSLSGEPVLGEIMQVNNFAAPATNIAALLQLFSYRDINGRNAKRFQWLDSGMIKLNPNLGSGMVTQVIQRTIKVFKPVTFGKNVDDQQTERGPGHVYLFVFGNSINNPVNYGYAYRTSYTDV